MGKTYLPTPPVPVQFRALASWLKTFFGVSLFGGQFNFEQGLYINNVHITPEDARKLKALISPATPAEDIAQHADTTNTKRQPRNKTPAADNTGKEGDGGFDLGLDE